MAQWVEAAPRPAAALGAAREGINKRAEFDHLVQRYHKQAYNIAYRMTGNHADAEDLTQEAFVRAFRFFGNYRRDWPFDNWLYKIMSNLFVDDLAPQAQGPAAVPGPAPRSGRAAVRRCSWRSRTPPPTRPGCWTCANWMNTFKRP